MSMLKKMFVSSSNLKIGSCKYYENIWSLLKQTLESNNDSYWVCLDNDDCYYYF